MGRLRSSGSLAESFAHKHVRLRDRDPDCQGKLFDEGLLMDSIINRKTGMCVRSA